MVDQLGYLCGIVTDRDIAIRGVAEGRSPDATVEAVMTRDVATVAPNADLTTAEAIMSKRGVRRLPVADDMWRPHGMISMDDILRAFGHEVDIAVAAPREALSILGATLGTEHGATPCRQRAADAIGRG